MSEITLITKNVWHELSNAARQTKTKSTVAVAYFGTNGSKMLPLKKGSTLVVDASLKALKSGQTCPHDLLKLYSLGVNIYSVENLHVKLFVLGKTMFCGSTNVSGNSANNLIEIILKTTNKQAVSAAETYIKSLCRVKLGEESINKMIKYYKAPKSFNSKKDKKDFNSGQFYIANLRNTEWSEREEREADKGRQIAIKNKIKKSRHRIDEFTWGEKINFKYGDTILQIIKQTNGTFVCPVGTMIHIRKWSNGKKIKHICYVEVPDKRSKRLELVSKKLDTISAKAITRGGRKSLELEQNLIQLWK